MALTFVDLRCIVLRCLLCWFLQFYWPTFAELAWTFESLHQIGLLCSHEFGELRIFWSYPWCCQDIFFRTGNVLKRSVIMATVVWHNFVLWFAVCNLDFNIFVWPICCDLAWQFSDMDTVWSFDAYVSLTFEKERSGCFTSVFGSFLKWKIDKLWMGF